MTALKTTFCLNKARACPTDFRATFAAVFDLIYWFREFPLSAVANRCELRCQSRATNAIVLQKLSLLSQDSLTIDFCPFSLSPIADFSLLLSSLNLKAFVIFS